MSCSDRHGKTAVDLAWHPVMKEALRTTPVRDHSVDKVLLQLLLSDSPIASVSVINKTKFLNDTDFVIRMLYKYSY